MEKNTGRLVINFFSKTTTKRGEPVKLNASGKRGSTWWKKYANHCKGAIPNLFINTSSKQNNVVILL